MLAPSSSAALWAFLLASVIAAFSKSSSIDLLLSSETVNRTPWTMLAPAATERSMTSEITWNFSDLSLTSTVFVAT
jgi:hypothetical protein